MSVQSMTWALAQSDLKDPTARHVLLCLANYADRDGRGAFPSTASLCADTGLSVRTVKYKLDFLEAEGFICRGNQAIAAAYIDRHDRRPVVYDLCVERGASAAPSTQRGANDDATGCISRQNGVQMKTERGAPAAPNPSLNHQLSKEQGASAPVKATKFDPLTGKPENVTAEIWADWCQHRKEIRKPLTATSCRQQAALIANHSNPDDVIRLSIANGWTGLFPEKTHASSSQHRSAGRPSAIDQVRDAIAARAAADAEAAAGTARQALAEDDRNVRPPLDGEFRRVG